MCNCTSFLQADSFSTAFVLVACTSLNVPNLELVRNVRHFHCLTARMADIVFHVTHLLKNEMSYMLRFVERGKNEMSYMLRFVKRGTNCKSTWWRPTEEVIRVYLLPE